MTTPTQTVQELWAKVSLCKDFGNHTQMTNEIIIRAAC